MVVWRSNSLFLTDRTFANKQFRPRPEFGEKKETGQGKLGKSSWSCRLLEAFYTLLLYFRGLTWYGMPKIAEVAGQGTIVNLFDYHTNGPGWEAGAWHSLRKRFSVISKSHLQCRNLTLYCVDLLLSISLFFRIVFTRKIQQFEKCNEINLKHSWNICTIRRPNKTLGGGGIYANTFVATKNRSWLIIIPVKICLEGSFPFKSYSLF